MERQKFNVVYSNGESAYWNGFYIYRIYELAYLYDYELPGKELPCLDDAYLVINLNNLAGYSIEDYDRKPGDVIPTPTKPGAWIKVNEKPGPMAATFWHLWKVNGRYPK